MEARVSFCRLDVFVNILLVAYELFCSNIREDTFGEIRKKNGMKKEEEKNCRIRADNEEVGWGINWTIRLV